MEYSTIESDFPSHTLWPIFLAIQEYHCYFFYELMTIYLNVIHERVSGPMKRVRGKGWDSRDNIWTDGRGDGLACRLSICFVVANCNYLLPRAPKFLSHFSISVRLPKFVPFQFLPFLVVDRPYIPLIYSYSHFISIKLIYKTRTHNSLTFLTLSITFLKTHIRSKLDKFWWMELVIYYTPTF